MVSYESSQEQEKINFLKVIRNTEIAASAIQKINLAQYHTLYGLNFNTLTILNTSAESIGVYLDDSEVVQVIGNNGTFSFDWEDGVIYNLLSIENKSGGNAIAANAIVITIGRTGTQLRKGV
jgi:hypothetical protein